jgi:hypothetical protein
MGNTRAGNVHRIDTTAGFTDPVTIVAIKYVGTTGSSAIVKAGDSSGNTVYENALTTNQLCEPVKIRSNKGFHVTVASGAILYVYLEV